MDRMAGGRTLWLAFRVRLGTLLVLGVPQSPEGQLREGQAPSALPEGSSMDLETALCIVGGCIYFFFSSLF